MDDDWAGTDFALDNDLGVSNQGDYALLTGEKNVDMAVKRRLTTPCGSLFYDEEYGNAVYDILSDTMGEEWEIKATNALRECLDGESRIRVISIDVIRLNEERKAIFYITYAYQNGAENMNTIQGGMTDGGISIS